MTSQELINEIFNKLDEWRFLPAYQLERRVDIFFALYLKEIIKKRFKEEIELIIPEFPVRIGNLYKNKRLDNPNLSFKIDYVGVCKESDKVFLIELKTDDGSRREKQDWYLEMAQKNNIVDLVDGILDIYKATSSKKKYDNLISLLTKINWIDKKTMTNISHDSEIIILYIQPTAKDSGKNIVTFNNIIEYLSEHEDDFTKRFIQSLKKWINNPNE
ncbi:MAG: hypothetical protein LLG13_07005 [Bacteroidales bacterium]|nr:hypothetical protein [Bacteroidales bacterium]